MYDTSQALIILVEPDDVRQVFPTWPAEMQVAVCMRQDGACGVALFNQAERAEIGTRLRRQMGLPVGADAAGVLPLQGLNAADRRSLLRMLTESPQLVGEADDYLANYTYAVEEGLDPAKLMGLELSEPEPEPTQAPLIDRLPEFKTTRRVSKPVPVEARAPELQPMAKDPEEPAPSLPSFLRPAAQEGPGQGFKSARQILRDEPEEVLYHVRTGRDGWTTLSRERKPGRGAALELADRDQFYMREEDNTFAFAVGPSPAPIQGMPPCIRIKTEGLPQRMVDVLSDAPGRLSVKLDGGFLFLHAPVAPTKRKRSTAPAQPRRGGMGLRGAIALCGLSAAIGWIGLETVFRHNEIAVEKTVEQGIDWQQYRLLPERGRAG